VLLHHPFDFLKFVLLYLGGPFYYLSSQKEYIGILAGLFLILSWCYFAYRSKNSRIFSLQLVLLAFIFYIGLSAASTGAGRLGISDATSSRYMTPALMAWSALLVLYALNLSKKARYLMKPILIIKLLFLSSWQLHAIGYSGLGASFEQMISALALQLQIKDRIQTDMVYANQRKVLPLAKTASENKLSIFGTPRFQELTHSLGKIQLNQPNNPCLGSIDEISPIEGEDAYVKVQGWIYDPKTQQIPSFIQILDRDKKIVGYAFTGKRRSDLKRAISPKAIYAGFTGYMLIPQQGDKIILSGDNPDCHFLTIAK
jgi:hypothetical protein